MWPKRPHFSPFLVHTSLTCLSPQSSILTALAALSQCLITIIFRMSISLSLQPPCSFHFTFTLSHLLSPHPSFKLHSSLCIGQLLKSYWCFQNYLHWSASTMQCKDIDLPCVQIEKKLLSWLALASSRLEHARTQRTTAMFKPPLQFFNLPSKALPKCSSSSL